jgi:hypothetical protein
VARGSLPDQLERPLLAASIALVHISRHAGAAAGQACGTRAISFTFGQEVGDDETWSCFLQNLLPGSEVINFGVQAYGHDQMLLYLQEEGIKYHPDIVILGFVSMDMRRQHALVSRLRAVWRFRAARLDQFGLHASSTSQP